MPRRAVEQVVAAASASATAKKACSKDEQLPDGRSGTGYDATRCGGVSADSAIDNAFPITIL